MADQRKSDSELTKNPEVTKMTNVPKTVKLKALRDMRVHTGGLDSMDVKKDQLFEVDPEKVDVAELTREIEVPHPRWMMSGELEPQPKIRMAEIVAG